MQKKSKNIENIIEKFGLEINKYQADKIKGKEKDESDYLLLRSDYEDLLDEIRKITKSKKYIGLMSWLINRCFMMTPNMISNRDRIQTKLNKNRPLLLKILYDLNPTLLLKCFKKG